MCGIAGFVAAPGASPRPARSLGNAVEALAHRGPDGNGLYETEEVSLANTRLSIIDIPGGRQPMTNETGTVVVVYNGEIWNYRVLRDELSRRGHRFESRSDTEVLAHGYEEWGDELPAHLDGMFAFAIWDGPRRRLFLARDRLGKKPLYLLETRDGLAFGSDARSLFLVSGAQPEVDRSRIAEYLFRRYVVSPSTLFSGVVRLGPGQRASYGEGSLETSSYWCLDVTEEPTPLSPDELRALLQTAVEKRLMSDVPLGVLLSGGVDSAAVLALARESGAEALATFTVGFADPLFDERPAARETAVHFAADHHELELDSTDFLDALPRLAWFRDEPIAEASEVPLLLLSEFAGSHVSVVLSGDGGDEVFGGYPKYRADALLRAGGPSAGVALGGALRLLGRRRSHRQLERAARTVAIRDPLTRWASWFRSLEPDALGNVLAPDLAAEATPTALTAPLSRVLEPYAGLDAGRRMLLGDLFTYLPDNMLLRSDKVLMAASIEGRMPLLDIDIVTRASRSSARDRSSLRASKRVLRGAIEKIVPAAVLNRPKRGFPVPMERFLVDDARSVLERLVLSERALSRDIFRPDGIRAFVRREDSASKPRELFVLASLELWLRANVDAVTTAPATYEALFDEPRRYEPRQAASVRPAVAVAG